MANEIQIKFGSLTLGLTNNITVKNISVKESKDVKISPIPKANGSIAETARRSSIIITVEGDVSGAGYDDLRTKLDTLKSYLQDGKQQFTTDDDRYVTAQLKDFDFGYTVMMTLARWTATFVAHYPYWLAVTATTDEKTEGSDMTSGVGYTVNNPGNAPTRVKVEITAPAGSSIDDACQLENTTRGEIFLYRGEVLATKVLEVDNRYDTEDFQVLNDGVDDHKNFEGDFLVLSPGNNTIEFTGQAGTKVKLTFKGAWY